jgi:hypothetical protein
MPKPKTMKRVHKKRRNVVETYGLPVAFVIRARAELRAARPSLSHAQLDRVIRRVARNAPDWMIEYSDDEDDPTA